jgi:transcriptional regulator with XRE-family HTH domain
MERNLHEAIRDLRGDLTQFEFGRLLGLHQISITHLETGKHKASTGTLLKLGAYADANGRGDLGAIFHAEMQKELKLTEVSSDSLLLTLANEIRLVKALLIVIRDPKQAERVEDLAAYFAEELEEVDKPGREWRRGQRVANRIVALIRRGRGDEAIAREIRHGVTAELVRGYRMAAEGAKK